MEFCKETRKPRFCRQIIITIIQMEKKHLNLMKQVKTIGKVKTKKGGRVSTEGEDFEKVDHVTNGTISTQISRSLSTNF